MQQLLSISYLHQLPLCEISFVHSLQKVIAMEGQEVYRRLPGGLRMFCLLRDVVKILAQLHSSV